MFSNTCKGCKGCIRAWVPDNKAIAGTAKLPDDSYEIGDTVNVEHLHNVDEATASLFIFGFPLSGFFIGLFIATLASQHWELALFTSEFGKFLIGLSTSGLFALPAVLYSRHLHKKRLGLPEFQILSKATCEGEEEDVKEDGEENAEESSNPSEKKD